MQISVAERAGYSAAFKSHKRSLNYTDKMHKKFSLAWVFISHSQNIQIAKKGNRCMSFVKLQLHVLVAVEITTSKYLKFLDFSDYLLTFKT